jgi:threonine synthase
VKEKRVSGKLIQGLKCRLCGKRYQQEALNFCTEDFGPLEVDYDYEAIGQRLTRQTLEKRPFNMWRYRELLPIDGEPTVGLQVGGTPLVPAKRLAEALGVRKVWIKNRG